MILTKFQLNWLNAFSKYFHRIVTMLPGKTSFEKLKRFPDILFEYQMWNMNILLKSAF